VAGDGGLLFSFSTMDTGSFWIYDQNVKGYESFSCDEVSFLHYYDQDKCNHSPRRMLPFLNRICDTERDRPASMDLTFR
jgi:hypothetical protein